MSTRWTGAARLVGAFLLGAGVSPIPERDEVTVPAAVAEEIATFGATLPGWNDGPEFARNPLLFQEV